MVESRMNDEISDKVKARFFKLYETSPDSQEKIIKLSSYSVGFLAKYFKDEGVLDASSSRDEVMATLMSAFLFTVDYGADEVLTYLKAESKEKGVEELN